MKTSERLRRKIKRECPQIDYIDEVVFRREYGISDGVRFSWVATAENRPEIYSYDTMTDCLNKPIEAVYVSGGTPAPEGWLVGVNN